MNILQVVKKPFGYVWYYFRALSVIFVLLVCGKDDQPSTDSGAMITSNVLEPLPQPMQNFPSIFDFKPLYALKSCEIELEGSFLIDGYNSFCGSYSVALTNPIEISYVDEIEIEGKAKVYGEIVKQQSCLPPFDVSAEFEKAKRQNNNSRIPKKFLKKGKFKMEGKENLTLESGVYYFKEMKLEGEASLNFKGVSVVFVEEELKVGGQAILNISAYPFYLRILSRKTKIEGNGKVYGLLLSKETKVEGNGEIFGCVLSEEFEGEGNGKVHCDKVLSFSKIEVYPSEITLLAGENYSLSATAYDVKGEKLQCSRFEWKSEDIQVAAVSATSVVIAVSAGNTNVWAILENQNLKFFGEKSWIKVYQTKEFLLPSGRSITITYNHRKLPISLYEKDKFGNIQIIGSYTYHPTLDEITLSRVEKVGRGIVEIIPDWDAECSLSDTTQPNENPTDKIQCLIIRYTDVDGTVKQYKETITNYIQDGKNVSEYKDSLGRRWRKIFESPSPNLLIVTDEDAYGFTAKTFYKPAVMDGIQRFFVIKEIDKNGVETEYEYTSNWNLKKKIIRYDGKEYIFEVFYDSFGRPTGFSDSKGNSGSYQIVEDTPEKTVYIGSYFKNSKEQIRATYEDFKTTGLKRVAVELISQELKFAKKFDRIEITSGIGKSEMKKYRGGKLIEHKESFTSPDGNITVEYDKITGRFLQNIYENGKIILMREGYSPNAQLLLSPTNPLSPPSTRLKPKQSNTNSIVITGERYYVYDEENGFLKKFYSAPDNVGQFFGFDNISLKENELGFFEKGASSVYHFEFDVRDLRKSEKREGFSNLIFRYDEDGRLVIIDDARRRVREAFLYDPLDRIKERDFITLSEMETVEYFYDGLSPFGHVEGSVGKKTGVKTKEYLASFWWTKFGNILKKRENIDGTTYETSYLYDFDGEEKEYGITYPFGSTFIFQDNKMILSFPDNFQAKVESIGEFLLDYGFGITVSKQDNSRIVFKNGEEIFSYSATSERGEVVEKYLGGEKKFKFEASTPFEGLAVARDKITGFEYSGPVSVSKEYSYDDAGNRLFEHNLLDGSMKKYNYSNLGNLLSISSNGKVLKRYFYDYSDIYDTGIGRVVSITNGDESLSFIYHDINPYFDFEGDLRGNLSGVIKRKGSEEISAKYLYDDEGRRIKKKVNVRNCVLETNYIWYKYRIISEDISVKSAQGENIYGGQREYFYTSGDVDMPLRSEVFALRDKVKLRQKGLSQCFGLNMQTGAVSEVPISEATFEDDFSQPFQNNWNVLMPGIGLPPQNHVSSLTQAGGKLYAAISSEAGVPGETVGFSVSPKWTFTPQDFLFSMTMNVEEIRNTSFVLGISVFSYPKTEESSLLECMWFPESPTNTLCFLGNTITYEYKYGFFPISLPGIGRITYKMENKGGNLLGEIPEIGFSKNLTFYPTRETFGYAVFGIKWNKINEAESSIVKISFDHFMSSLKMKKSSFPYAEIEFLGERYNDYISELGGEPSDKNSYWVVKNGGGINIFKDSGSGIFLDLKDEKINLALVENLQGKRGSVFSNLSYEEFLSFAQSKGLEVIDFVDGAYIKAGTVYKKNVPEAVKDVFIPVKDRFAYIVSDLRAVPSVAFDINGNIIWRRDVGAFGEIIYEEGIKGFVPIVFPGQYKDFESGMYYNTFRYYDPETGRYLQPDPVRNLNPYSYAGNNSLLFFDSLGLFKIWYKPWSPYTVHEEIFKEAVNKLNLPKLYGAEAIPRNGCGWECSKLPCDSTIVGLTYIADCEKNGESDWHADGSNIFTPYTLAERIGKGFSISCGGGGGSGGVPARGGGNKGGGCGGMGCSVTHKPLNFPQSTGNIICSYELIKYETLGLHLHPAQDLWSHTNAVFAGCSKLEVHWYDIWCASTYPPVVRFTWDDFGDQSKLGFHGNVEMSSDKSDYYCNDPYLTQKLVSGHYNTSGDLFCWSDVLRHCHLNKDAGDNDPMLDDECEQDTKAHNEAKLEATQTTFSLLFKFCRHHPTKCLSRF